MKIITVGELVEHLKTLPQDIPVFTSTDDEGNGYRPVYKNWVGVEGYEDYDGEIEVGILELTEELLNQGYCEEDIKEKPCVIIG
jgi:hypothetical protein